MLGIPLKKLTVPNEAHWIIVWYEKEYKSLTLKPKSPLYYDF